MSETLPYGTEYDPDQWPHGLRCIDCERLLGEGDRYATRLEAISGDGIPIVEIICLECALSAREEGADTR